jgi:hypothetical protein
MPVSFQWKVLSLIDVASSPFKSIFSPETRLILILEIPMMRHTEQKFLPFIIDASRWFSDVFKYRRIEIFIVVGHGRKMEFDFFNLNERFNRVYR